MHHSAGATRFSRATRGLRHELDVFVDVDDPVKFSLLTLTNDSGLARRLSFFAYNDWVLGPPREQPQDRRRQKRHPAGRRDDVIPASQHAGRLLAGHEAQTVALEGRRSGSDAVSHGSGAAG